MSEPKKKPSSKRNKSKISHTRRPNLVDKNLLKTLEIVALTVLGVYVNLFKGIFALVARFFKYLHYILKPVFIELKPKLISLPYRIAFNAIKWPFVIIFFPFRVIFWVLKKIYFFEFRFRLISIKFIFLLLLFGIGYVASLFYITILRELPSGDNLYKYDPNLTTRIYDRKGNLLYSLYYDEDRSPVALSEIPENLKEAILAMEDEEFYSHHGLSYKGIIRAAKKTFIEDDIEGGSTITQQLVKNLLLTSDRTYERKIKEAVLALEVERRFTKDQILEMYLNNISFGGTSYGVKSASKKYFGKELSDLTLAEASFLAGLPGAPSVYSPFGSTPERGRDRQIDVLNRMVSANFISREDADRALEQELVFADKTNYIKYPHFVNYVIDELNRKYGQMFVAKGGLEVYTSIDPEIQDASEAIVNRQVTGLKRYNVKNGATLITNPATGEILAMVGSKNYWDEANDGNVNVTTAQRQPGSSIKPLTYAIAIEKGATPSTLVSDTPVEYKLPNGDTYKPVNYDGRFHGVMPIRSALANSYNIPPVKLVDEMGVEEILNWAPDFGITTWTEPERYGLSITLGAAEVKMTEMATMYGVFANAGERIDLDPVLKIYDAYGNTIHENGCVSFDSQLDESILTRRMSFEFRNNRSQGDAEGITAICDKTRVVSERTAFYITDILSDNRARTPAFGGNSNLNIKSKQVAVKTGTTTSIRDNWAIGYSKEFVVVSWIGNNDNTKMGNISSGGTNSASAMWRETFNYLLDNRTVANKIAINPEMVEVSICPLTGTLSCDACKGVRQSFVKGDEPTRRCSNSDIERIKGDEDDNDDDDDDSDNNDEDSRGYDYWVD